MLKGQKAIVTGGGSGIGQSSALELARNNATVIILGREEEKLVETVRIARREHLAMAYQVCDVSDKCAVDRLFAALSSTGFIPDVVVNCAGIVKASNVACSVDNIVFQINIGGTINVCEAAIPIMISQGKKGEIINVASLTGHNGSSDYPLYAASKGAVISYTKSLALKYGPNGIRANSISPGIIVTHMSYEGYPNFNSLIPSLIEMHPLHRLGKPEDVAKVVVFLATDMSQFITGQDIIVDGGFTLRE